MPPNKRNTCIKSIYKRSCKNNLLTGVLQLRIGTKQSYFFLALRVTTEIIHIQFHSWRDRRQFILK